ncbi:MAG: hypothetical protein A3K03_13640 [Bdellovibrionales bacterium RIFOXYD1_FULL_44_7]|nr:MAG: hypothetical protein A3K03_13640 [Bdellovibrionales bacterium RIFOXYD1_FULL_44_7]
MPTTLNWRELEKLTQSISSTVAGLFVEKIFVPARPRFLEGFLKGELAIRLSSKQHSSILLFSIRPRHPYVTIRENEKLKAYPEATHSPFALVINKYLYGNKVDHVEAIKQERVLIFWFQKRDNRQLGLVLILIPSSPEALLIEKINDTSTILASSKVSSKVGTSFTPPDGSKAPPNPEVRDDLLKNFRLWNVINEELEQEAFCQRMSKVEQTLRKLSKQTKSSISHQERSLTEARKDRNWGHYGDLLKTALSDPPPLQTNEHGRTVRIIKDFFTGGALTVECDPKLSVQEQVEKFYQLSKRNKRRIKESEFQLQELYCIQNQTEKLLNTRIEIGDWSALDNYEKEAGIRFGNTEAQERERKQPQLGKTFTTKEGLIVKVGRSKDENLALTFKLAKGNDVWLHARGRPSAHAIIQLPKGKTASLDSLLDAANLVLYYSGYDYRSDNPEKVEVDYTFRKHVKRIKDSSEVSYTNNRTLIIKIDSDRIKRLTCRA